MVTWDQWTIMTPGTIPHRWVCSGDYDVVVTWSNYNYSSASGMGNILADYIDEGGRSRKPDVCP